MAVLAMLPLHTWGQNRANSQHVRFAAAWAQGSDLFVGVLAAPSAPEQPLHIVQAHSIPTRAHGMTQLADGSLLFASRRPGDWLLHIAPSGQEQWLWIEPDRAFNGHVIASLDGQHLYATETDLADRKSVV